jgi:hypothetical protein
MSPFLGAFINLRNVNLNCAAHLSVGIKQHIVFRYNTGGFYEKLVRIFSFCLDLTTLMITLHNRIST